MGPEEIKDYKIFIALPESIAPQPEILMPECDHVGIECVIFNAPTTIVYWDDGEKTVVKCSQCSRNCSTYKSTDGACCVAGSTFHWKWDGLMNATLKRFCPGYIDEFNKALEMSANGLH